MGFHDAKGFYHHSRAVINVSLNDFREVTSAGAVANIAGNGGLLASDTTPILGAEATTETMVIIWAAGNSDIIQAQISLPPDFQGRDDVHVELDVRTDNAGGGGIEAASFTVLSAFGNAAQITDSATDSVPSETVHTVTAVISAADIPDTGSRFLNLQLVAGTHANDPIRLLGCRVTYVRDKAA